MKKLLLFVAAMAMTAALPIQAQVKIKAVAESNRYDGTDGVHEKGDQMVSDYVGYINGKAMFIVENGIYSFNVDADAGTVSTPVKDPAGNKSDFYSGGQVTDPDKAAWASNFNLMIGNSGAVYIDGVIATIFSRDYQSTTDEELFAVRKWDAKTGNLLAGANDFFHANTNIESAGMAYNPVDGKVYGLFYLTEQQLRSEITDDPDFFVDEDGDATSTDAGYCICTIDLQTMKITPVTPGLYYYNFITFAINSEGRAFALTSGGSNGAINADGKMEDINGNLSGAQLCEFDLTTGLMQVIEVPAVDEETGEPYVAYENIYPATGYASQYRRQSACFAASNPYKMYWNGYYNSGKGINDNGSWSSLSDKEWITNGKYDTCIYEIDITTGNCRRVAKIPNRWIFSCMWVEGDDSSDGSGLGEYISKTVTSGIDEAKTATTHAPQQIFNAAGQRVSDMSQKGLYIVKEGNETKKVLVK